ncbi:MAG TPA: type II toxin-antitoxin system VapC family toxin [Thermoanaerobaculia bacterium]
MIGVDTNVLVRYLTQDDMIQARIVDTFLDAAIENGSQLRVDDIVLCEVVWVLRAAYRLGKSAIAEALDRVMNTAIFSFDDREILRGTLADYLEGEGDFSVYLIGRRNARAGCDHTVTFDRQLTGRSSFVLL